MPQLLVIAIDINSNTLFDVHHDQEVSIEEQTLAEVMMVKL